MDENFIKDAFTLIDDVGTSRVGCDTLSINMPSVICLFDAATYTVGLSEVVIFDIIRNPAEYRLLNVELFFKNVTGTKLNYFEITNLRLRKDQFHHVSGSIKESDNVEFPCNYIGGQDKYIFKYNPIDGYDAYAREILKADYSFQFYFIFKNDQLTQFLHNTYNIHVSFNLKAVNMFNIVSKASCDSVITGQWDCDIEGINYEPKENAKSIFEQRNCPSSSTMIFEKPILARQNEINPDQFIEMINKYWRKFK